MVNKTKILECLTSSKNERLAFACVFDLTIGRKKGNCIIYDKDFKQYGLNYRNRRNEAVLRLIDKGLIFRAEQDPYWYNAEHRVFRYSVKKSGCVRFLETKEVMCD